MVFGKKSQLIGIYCDVYDRNVSFDECIDCEECMSRYSIISLIEHAKYEEKKYPPFEKGTMVFRTSSICSGNKHTNGLGCQRQQIFNYFFSKDYYASLKDLYIPQRGTQLHAMFLKYYFYTENRFFHEYTYKDTPVLINCRIDGYDERRREIDELKFSQYLPSNNRYVDGAFFKHIKQVQLQMALADASDFIDLDIISGNVIYHTMGDTNGDTGTIRDYVESYPVEKDPEILDEVQHWCNGIIDCINDIKVNIENKEKQKIQWLPKKIAKQSCTYCAHEEICKKYRKMKI